jgi:hypothetical protein
VPQLTACVIEICVFAKQGRPTRFSEYIGYWILPYDSAFCQFLFYTGMIAYAALAVPLVAPAGLGDGVA